MTSVAVVGLGEVGRVIAEETTAFVDGPVRAWDVAFADRQSQATRNAADLGLPVDPLTAADVVAGAQLVFSAVTAANTLAAAESVASALAPGAWFVDLNSASPGQKQEAAKVVEAAGGRYVEAAVMSPIHPRRLAAPVLLGGPHAAAFAPVGAALGWSMLEIYSDQVGPAAATKLCRSVVVKGLEALVTESMLAARSWGVEQKVLASLGNVIPHQDWPAFAAYLIARTTEHGTRRAEEMREAVDTVAQVGVEPLMATATAQRQDWAGRFGPIAGARPGAEDLVALLDAMGADS